MKRNSVLGCSKYGTAIMKKEEVLLFVETALSSGSDIPEAFADMKMIDTMLHAERLHLAAGSLVRKTASGRYRKGSDLYTMLSQVVDARLTNSL